MKKYKVEQDVKMTILPDKILSTDYAPPIVPERKIESQNDQNKNNNTRKAKNNNFVSMVNEFLGVGGFSKVYRYKKEKDKAIKKIMLDPLIYKCACKHTIKLYEIYQNQASDAFYLLMELCEGNLEQLVTKLGRPLKTLEIKEVLNQLNEVFYKLYINNIIHRDIKPANILYIEDKNNKKYNKDLFDGKNYTFKLTDFGVCLPLYDAKYSISQCMFTSL